MTKEKITVECLPHIPLPKGMKQCGRCEKIQFETDFYRGESICKDCSRIRVSNELKRLKEEDPEKYKARQKKHNSMKRSFMEQKPYTLEDIAEKWRHPWDKMGVE